MCQSLCPFEGYDSGTEGHYSQSIPLVGEALQYFAAGNIYSK